MKTTALKKNVKGAKGAAKKTGVSKAAAAAPAPSADFENFSSSDDDDEQDNAGFDSSDDENDNDEDDVMVDTPAEGKKTAVAKSNRPKKTVATKKPGSGVVYLGRIPHGFYEEQMQAYFTQFGPISRLRLSRNKKTGASKHFAFIEFENKETAQVAAETMNNYLLFGHILKCKVVPEDEVHESLFEGANKQYRVLPRAQVAQLKSERPRSRAKWESLKEKSASLLSARMKRLNDMGINYKYTPIADVRVPKQAATGAAEGAKKKKQRTSLA